MSSFPIARLVLVALIIATAFRSVAAQPPAKVGTVVIAHGGDSLWNSKVIEAAEAAHTGGPVAVSFLMGPAAARTRFQDVVATLELSGVQEIVVVPLLVSSHSGHYEQIRWLAGDSIVLDDQMRHHLHMSGIERPTSRIPIRVAPALDDAPELARVLADRGRALAASLGVDPSSRALLLVGHGPNSAEDNAAWMKALRSVADSVRGWTGFRDVRVDLVRDDAPAAVRAEAVQHVRELIALQSAMTGADVLVVPVLIATGSISRDKLPADLSGTPHRYLAEPLLPHPALVRWIERRALDR